MGLPPALIHDSEIAAKLLFLNIIYLRFLLL